MKKKICLGLAAVSFILLSGCSAVRDLSKIVNTEKSQKTQSSQSTQQPSATKETQTASSSELNEKTPSEWADLLTAKEKDALYSEISSRASNPELLENSDIYNKRIVFVAQMEGEPEQSDSEDESLKDQWYVPVYLMRNWNKAIYLNVTKIPKEDWPENGDVIRIEGKAIGYLYSTVDNELVNMLDVEANAIEILTFEDEKAPSSNVIETDFYRIEITGTDLLYDVFDEPNLIVYYKYKNKRDRRAVSPVDNYFFFNQGEEWLKHSIHINTEDGLDSKAIHGESLDTGVELLYYESFPLASLDESVVLTVYDDEYNLLNNLEIPIPVKE